MESRKTVEGARDSASRNPLSFAARAFGSCFAPSFDTLPDKAAKPDTNNSQSSSSSSTSTAAPSLSGSSSHGRASTNRRSGKGMVLHSANTTTNTTSTNGRRSGKGMMMLHSANTTTNPATPSLSGSIYGGGSLHGRASTNSRRSGKGMMLHSAAAAAAAAAVTQPHQIGSLKFDMAEIQKATNNFSSSLKIGQGGFGTVYKGTLEDGTVVAIKRAKKNLSDSHQGSSEFQSEIKTLAQVEHLNLVRFLGYLEQDDERIVVVEYVPNGNLREHLDGIVHGRSQPQLDLAVRLDIAIDVAHAVTYLHMYTDHPIIHRDIKSSNILLTENLRAKVADFGFARMGATEGGMTHVSTQVKGTAGYLDPEYLKTYQLTDKSDVYSFGVLLVELISGRRPIEPKREHKERITPKWAIKNFADGNAIEVLDPNLDQNRATNLALEKMLELAFQCLAPTRQGRPSMRRCAEILWSIRKDYRELLASDSISRPSRQRKPPSIIKEK